MIPATGARYVVLSAERIKFWQYDLQWHLHAGNVRTAKLSALAPFVTTIVH